MSQSVAARFEFVRCKLVLVSTCLDNAADHDLSLDAHALHVVVEDVLREMDDMALSAPETLVFEPGARHACQ